MSELHLLLIGGGEIGAPKSDGTFRPLETLAIDEHFVRSLNKKKPHILFIPTATELMDANRLYEKGFRTLYGEKLGCSVDSLYLSDNPSPEDIDTKLRKADALYIGGGDNYYMFNQWKKFGLDIRLQQVAQEGKPIAGISAGAMCWFNKMLVEDEKGMDIIDGFGLLEHFLVPHWNKYQKFLESPLAKQEPFIAIDNCCALEIKGTSQHLIKSKSEANAYFIDLKSDTDAKINNLVK